LPDRLIPYIEQERRAVARLETALVSRAPDL
jgi:hypothetical protein